MLVGVEDIAGIEILVILSAKDAGVIDISAHQIPGDAN